MDSARNLASDCCWMVALQAKRLETAEAEEPDFLSRQAADFQFLIVALARLRKAALVAQSVRAVSADVASAVAAFDSALPGLTKMRNVGEHIENYAIDSPKRHNKSVDSRMLGAVAYDEKLFMWLGEQLDVAKAQQAADALLEALKDAQREVAMSS